ncbi:transposase [Burkholderia pseudomallei]|uniref:transposase n=1 Tax=Burkholderia pseudomallei TaxID=28450 RepID=UPI000975F93A|nr:transposase [Burkholderia pseudomallei]
MLEQSPRRPAPLLRRPWYDRGKYQRILRARNIPIGIAPHGHPRGRGFRIVRWAVERSFAWAARFRRLARDYGRLPQTLAGFHFPAVACLMPPKIFDLIHTGS